MSLIRMGISRRIVLVRPYGCLFPPCHLLVHTRCMPGLACASHMCICLSMLHSCPPDCRLVFFCANIKLLRPEADIASPYQCTAT